MSKFFTTSYQDFSIREGLKPGDLGYITYLHGTIYSTEYGFNTTFEPYVAKPLSDFSLSEDKKGQRIWVVERKDKVVGSIAIVRQTVEEAQLRWLILDSDSRGFGLGRKLVELALDFCHDVGYHKVFLWTVSILGVAAHLYTSFGFHRTEWKKNTIWGRELTEEKYELVLN